MVDGTGGVWACVFGGDGWDGGSASTSSPMAGSGITMRDEEQ